MALVSVRYTKQVVGVDADGRAFSLEVGATGELDAKSAAGLAGAGIVELVKPKAKRPSKRKAAK